VHWWSSAEGLHRGASRSQPLLSKRSWKVSLSFPPQGTAVPSFKVGGCGGENTSPLRGAAAARACARKAPTVMPNTSLQPTVIGMALGPRGAAVYHAPHGPSAMPLPAAELER
jgi:hypothetical protein